MILFVLTIVIAALLLGWAMNLSFAAHIAKDNKQLYKYHITSFFVVLIALCILGLGIHNWM